MSVVQAYIVMDGTERTAAMALNNENFAVNPQQIANPLADQLGHGTLVGLWVVPARVLNDPDYSDWVSMFSDNDIYVFDTDTIFIPEEARAAE